jgi:hypothetical protein
MGRWRVRTSAVLYAIMRIVVGFLFACHGAQKLFGVFGAHSRASETLLLAGHGARTRRVLAHREHGRARRALLFCVPLHCIARIWCVEHRRAGKNDAAHHLRRTVTHRGRPFEVAYRRSQMM